MSRRSKDMPKFMSVADANNNLSHTIAEAQNRRIVITKHGKPVAMLVGCDGHDMEDIMTAADPAFWRMIEKRSQPGRKTVSLAEVRKKSKKLETKENQRKTRKSRG